MMISENYYRLFLTTYRENDSIFNLILTYRILDELVDHDFDYENNNLGFLNQIFNFCEKTLFDACYDSNIFNNLLKNNFEYYSQHKSSNATILFNIFASFGIVVQYYLNSNKKFDFSSLKCDTSKFLLYIDNFIKNDFKNEIFFNLNK